MNCLLIKFTLLCGYCLLIGFNRSQTLAQFPPQVPLEGHQGISANDSRITAWATSCSVNRGWVNIMDTTLGKVTAGHGQMALGPAGLESVSLGDGGEAVLTFDLPIKNVPGPDFAVFENAFANPINDTLAFLELAFVAVSSDGQHFVTFPAISNTPDTAQLENDDYNDARFIHNLAGKYLNGYGTPFDLEELIDSPNLDLNDIRFVRITDVVGSLQPEYASYDSRGVVINDPFPTPFPTGGFDLKGVAVLQADEAGLASERVNSALNIYPNPAREVIRFYNPERTPFSYRLFDGIGRLIMSQVAGRHESLGLSAYPVGLYQLRLYFPNGTQKEFKLIHQK